MIFFTGTKQRVFRVGTLDGRLILLMVLLRAIVCGGCHLQKVGETFAVASDSILISLRERDVTLFEIFSKGVCDERLVCLTLLIRIGPIFLTRTSL